MPRLTKKEKVAQFHYNLKKFSMSMDNYENFINRATGYRNRLKISDKNEMGKIAEDRAKEMTMLENAITDSDEKAEEQLAQACDAFDELRKLLG